MEDPIAFVQYTRRPTSNAERQREFRKRNPGYEARRKAAQRARTKAFLEAMRAAERAKAAEQAAAAETVALPSPAVVIQPHKQLALPAPVEPLFVIPTLAEIRERAGGGDGGGGAHRRLVATAPSGCG